MQLLSVDTVSSCICNSLNFQLLPFLLLKMCLKWRWGSNFTLFAHGPVLLQSPYYFLLGRGEISSKISFGKTLREVSGLQLRPTRAKSSTFWLPFSSFVAMVEGSIPIVGRRHFKEPGGSNIRTSVASMPAS